MATTRKWITGPALKTVCALRGIQPGDEIQVKVCRKKEHQGGEDEKFARRRVLYVTGIDPVAQDACPIAYNGSKIARDPEDYYWACWCGIKAWRPKQ